MFAHFHPLAFRTFLFLMIAPAVLLLPRRADSAVPASLTPRAQDAAVEAILKALDDKAAAARDATVRSGTGLQDQPAVEYVTGLAGPRWFFKRADGGAGAGVYSDGQEFFEPDNRLRYALDTLEAQRRAGFNLNHLLLHANLRPRQFLSPRLLANLGNVTVDRAQYVRLSADLAADPAAQKDPSAMAAPPSPRVARIDYYVDEGRAAIARVAVTFSDDSQVVSSVASWDALGTGAQWPKQLLQQRLEPSGVGDDPGPSGVAVLTTVNALQLGPDAGVDQAAAATAAVPFYGGVVYDLRKPRVYAAATQASAENVTEQVWLAQAYFAAGQPQEGVAQWDVLSQRLGDAAQRDALSKVMLQAAAESVAQPKATAEGQQRAAADLIRRLLAMDLSDEQWYAVSRPVALGWSRLRGADYTAARELAASDDAVIARALTSGNRRALRILLSTASNGNTAKALAEKIDAALLNAATAPLPPAGYAGSRQSELVGLCISANLWDRVDQYTQNLTWDAGTPESAKASVQAIRAMVEVVPKVADPQVIGVLLEQYNRAVDPQLPADDFTREAIRLMAVKVGVLAVRSGYWVKENPPKPAAFIAAAAGKQNAASYFDEVLAALVTVRPTSRPARQYLVDAAAEVGAAVEQQFNAPGTVSRTWLRLGTAPLYNPRASSPLARLEYLNKALSTAANDQQRVQAAQAIARTFASVGQHDQALQALAAVKGTLGNPDSAASVDIVAQEVTRDKTRAQQQLAQRQRRIDADRVGGRLAYLQQQLAEAQKRERPAAEIQSLQAVIDQTKQEAEALAKQE